MNYDLQALDRALAARIREKKLPGCSVAIRGPEGELFQKGYGFCDMEHARPVNGDTVFGIASMSKSTVALSLCILAAEGRISLDQPVTDFLPQFRIPGQPRDAVAVRHLLTHTAGIPPMEPLEWSIALNTPGREGDWVRRMKASSPNRMDKIEQIIDYIAHCPYETLGAPGEYMSYSNEGYAVLCTVFDIAAGVPLEQFLDERVFGPMGMTRTVLDGHGERAIPLSGGNITRLFDNDDDGSLTCDDRWSTLPPFRSCACVKSTARDMARYYACIAARGKADGKQVIPAQAVELLVGAAFPLRERSYYCCGLNKRVKYGHVICEHSGGLHGVSTHGGLLLDEGWGFSALCNKSNEDTDDLVWMMYNMIMGRPLEEDHRWLHPTGKPFADPEMLLGRYLGHEGTPTTVTVTLKDGVLMGDNDQNDLGPFRLVWCSGTWFQGWRDGDTAPASRERFYVRNGRAWGLKVGTRIFRRIPD